MDHHLPTWVSYQHRTCSGKESWSITGVCVGIEPVELYPDFFFFGRPAQRLSLALTGNGGTKRMGSADSVYGQFQRLHASFYISLFLLGFHNFSPTILS